MDLGSDVSMWELTSVWPLNFEISFDQPLEALVTPVAFVSQQLVSICNKSSVVGHDDDDEVVVVVVVELGGDSQSIK